jgi:divalent metal cation (Fe/Co/Zn/Cd) transporter
LFAAGFILYNSYLIFRPALGEIMDEHVYDDLIAQIREVALQVPGITDTEKCFIRKAGMKYHVDLHAVVDGNLTVKEGHDLAHQLKDTLRTELPALGHVLIHIEPHYAGL